MLYMSWWCDMYRTSVSSLVNWGAWLIECTRNVFVCLFVYLFVCLFVFCLFFVCLLIIHRWKSPAAYPMNYTQVKIPCTVPDELYTGENRQHHTLWVIHRCKSPSPYPMNYTQVKIASTIPNELYTGENHTLWVIHWCKSPSPYPMNYTQV